MNCKTDRDEIIYRMWAVEGLTFQQISERELPSFLSLSRIRRICYGGKGRITTVHQKEIYCLFRLKFLELQNVDEAVKFILDNQPPVRRSIPQIRKIINQQHRKQTKHKQTMAHSHMIRKG